MQLLKKFLKGEQKAEMVIASAAFVVMVFMTALNVFSRYILQKSFAFAEEISYLGFTWSTFIGMGYCFRKRSLVAVDVFVNRMPEQVRRVVEVVVDVILLLTNVGLSYLSLKMVISGWTRRSPTLRIPYTFYYLPVLVVCFIMLVTTVYFLSQHLKKTEKPGEESGQ